MSYFCDIASTYKEHYLFLSYLGALLNDVMGIYDSSSNGGFGETFVFEFEFAHGNCIILDFITFYHSFMLSVQILNEFMEILRNEYRIFFMYKSKLEK